MNAPKQLHDTLDTIVNAMVRANMGEGEAKITFTTGLRVVITVEILEDEAGMMFDDPALALPGPAKP